MLALQLLTLRSERQGADGAPNRMALVRLNCQTTSNLHLTTNNANVVKPMTFFLYKNGLKANSADASLDPQMTARVRASLLSFVFDGRLQ